LAAGVLICRIATSRKHNAVYSPGGDRANDLRRSRLGDMQVRQIETLVADLCHGLSEYFERHTVAAYRKARQPGVSLGPLQAGAE